MKPNWKKCAKTAYQKGIRAGDGWVPARDPPPKSKKYICVVCRVLGGIILPRIEVLRYYKMLKHWEGNIDGSFVLYWKDFPKVPEINPDDIAQLIDLEHVEYD